MAHKEMSHGLWLICILPMTHSYVSHDSFLCEPWLIHMCALNHIIRMSHVTHIDTVWYVCYDSFVRVPWLISMWAMTHSYVCLKSLQHTPHITATQSQQQSCRSPLLQLTASHCNTVQHPASRCNTLQQAVKHCNTLQHTATHCNTPHHTATQSHQQSCRSASRAWTCLTLSWVRYSRCALNCCNIPFTWLQHNLNSRAVEVRLDHGCM